MKNPEKGAKENGDAVPGGQVMGAEGGHSEVIQQLSA